MQPLFTALLVLVLAVSVVAFVAMGAAQRLRRRQLAEHARLLGLEFSGGDPLEIPLCYGDFVLMAAGHSPRAENVSYGRIGPCRLRVFDFSYEVGHGIRRSTRLYATAVLQIGDVLDSVLMWHQDDLADAPLIVGHAGNVAGNWLYSGSGASAGGLAEACADLAELGASMQMWRDSLMIWAPTRGRGRPYRRLLDMAGDLCSRLCPLDNQPDQPVDQPEIINEER
ncbi:MAG: hypothetical protein ACYS8X_00480 [Planctomycetota bacterium]